MEDDTKLKIVFYVIIALSVVSIIGIWENFIKPIINYFISHISVIG
jgi:hypothetical protein